MRDARGASSAALTVTVRVRDFVEVPIPLLIVQRAEPEGVKVKGTKSGRTRRVPVTDRIIDLVQPMASGRGADERLFVTAAGYRLHQSAFKRTLKWPEVADGRRIHDYADLFVMPISAREPWQDRVIAA